MIYLHVGRGTEAIEPAPHVVGRLPTSRHCGHLALATLRTLRPKDAAADLAYLQQYLWKEGISVPRGSSERWRAELRIVRDQLAEIAANRGRLTWDEYSEHTVEDDGPTATLRTHDGRQLLRAIHWRLPLTADTQRLVLETPVAAVLLSLIEGFRAGTLIVCRDCKRFVYRPPNQPQRRRCARCNERRQFRLSKQG